MDGEQWFVCVSQVCNDDHSSFITNLYSISHKFKLAVQEKAAQKAVSAWRKNKTTNGYLRLCQSLDTWLVFSTSDRNQATAISNFKLCRSTQPQINVSDRQQNSYKAGQWFLLLQGGRTN